MIPIIVPFIPSSDRDHDGRRPNVFGILLSVIILSIGLFLAFFLILTREFTSPIPVISIIMVLIVVIMGLVIVTMVTTSVRTPEVRRDEYSRRQPPIRDFDRDRSNKEYCPECGTLVELSDSFCTTCGSRLQRWK